MPWGRTGAQADGITAEGRPGTARLDVTSNLGQGYALLHFLRFQNFSLNSMNLFILY